MYSTLHWGGQTFSTFSLCLAVGLLCALYVGLYTINKYIDAPNRSSFYIALPLLTLSSVVGAFLSDVYFRGGFSLPLTAWGQFGGTFLGGLLGGILFTVVYGQIGQHSLGVMLNLFLPLYAIGQAFGRIGCFLGGCCYGVPTETCLGVIYPAGSYPNATYPGIPLFPVQLVESVLLFSLSAILYGCIRFRYRAAVYLFSIAVIRFALEFFRADPRGTLATVTHLSPAQLLSCALAIGGIILFAIEHRNAKPISP